MSEVKCSEQMPDGSYRTAIPMPFWEKSRRTWFRYKPMCCDTIFKDEEAYRDHYVRMHIAD